MPPHEIPTLNKLYYGDNLAVLRDYIPTSPSTSSTSPALQLPAKSVQRPLHVRDVTFKKAPRNRPTPAQNLSLNLSNDLID